jgi:CRISPR-associated protein Csd2
MKRATGLLVLEVRDSNPNGDPDRESDPRQRTDGRGEISPVSLKRKTRDLVEDKQGIVWKTLAQALTLKEEEFQILESRDARRADVKKLLEGDEALFEKFKQSYWDARVFGNTFLEEGQGNTIRSGVVHFGLGLSVAPIEVERLTQTKKAPAEEGKSRGMAPMSFRVVQHGVYYVPFFVNPTAAHKTGCTERDIKLLHKLIPLMFDHTRSVIRSQIGILHAHLVTHKTPLGSFNEFRMLDALTPKLKEGLAKGVSVADYVIPKWEDVPQDLRGKAESYNDLVEEYEL